MAVVRDIMLIVYMRRKEKMQTKVVIVTERLILREMREDESWGCQYIEEYPDEDNGITKVYAISREAWKQRAK